MYNPGKYRITDLVIVQELIQAYPLGVITSNDEDYPMASPIPMIARIEEEAIILTGHMARNNPHFALLKQQAHALTMFQGASSYVSSFAKDPEYMQILPTWNYMVAQLWGELSFVPDSALRGLMQEMLDVLETPFPKQVDMDQQNQRSLEGKLKAIAGFRIRVSRVEACYRLNQNRNASIRGNIQQAYKEFPNQYSEELIEAIDRFNE